MLVTEWLSGPALPIAIFVKCENSEQVAIFFFFLICENKWRFFFLSAVSLNSRHKWRKGDEGYH